MDFDRMLALSKEGFQCAQILMLLALELDDEENSGLLRTVGGLNMGLADTQGSCGALSGGCCFISYFAGKGDATELEDPAYKDMLSEFTAWFREKYGSQICTDLLEGDKNNMLTRCPEIIQASYLKATTILEENGVI